MPFGIIPHAPSGIFFVDILSNRKRKVHLSLRTDHKTCTALLLRTYFYGHFSDITWASCRIKPTTKSSITMTDTGQLGGPVLKASGRIQNTLFQTGDKSPMIIEQHIAGGSVSQLKQLTKLSPWLTRFVKDITISCWHYNKWFWCLSNQIIGLYHFSHPIK